MLVPLLVVVIGLPIKTVVGTTLLIVAIKSITGFSGDVLSQFASIDWIFLARFMLAMAIGVLVGSNVAQRIDPTTLKKSFSWFLLFIAFFVSAKELFELRSTQPQREQQKTHHIDRQPSSFHLVKAARLTHFAQEQKATTAALNKDKCFIRDKSQPAFYWPESPNFGF